MKRTTLRIVFYGVLGIMAMQTLDSCRAIRKSCGCGSDLNKAYKPPRRFRY